MAKPLKTHNTDNYTVKMKKQIEWHETTMIEDIDNMIEVIEKAYSVQLEPGYLDTFNAVHIVDWKCVVERFLSDLVTEIQNVMEAIDQLPDDEFEEYEVTEDE